MKAAGTKTESRLPDDIDALKALVASQSSMIDSQSTTIASQKDRISRLEHNVEVFRRMLFAASSERRRNTSEESSDGSARQGLLFMAELVEEAERAAEKNDVEGSIEEIAPPKPMKKTGGRRKKFPPHLPVVRTTYELREKDRICDCGGDLHVIGEDVRKELERIELSIVHEIACKKYGCRSCNAGVKTAPGPDRVIDKGILGKGFLAHVITERFLNHMPYHRLEKKYASEGLDLHRSVLQRSMARVAELLKPIHDQLGRDVLASKAMFTDDTTVTIAQDREGRRRTGRIWIYRSLEDHHYYDFTESRNRDGPERILGKYSEYVHADAYPLYDVFFTPDGATEVACWAHARRGFVEAENSDPELSKEAIDRIRLLNKIEKAAKDLDDDARLAYRQKFSLPILEDLKAWLELTRGEVLPKSPMGKAITYTLNQWEALVVYTTKGFLKIDNNAAERALRAIAVGRKNWLFFQREGGGHAAAIIVSLVQTAKEIGLDPRTYLRDVMTRIAHCSDVKKLTPHGWKEHFADEVAKRQDLALRLITTS